MDGGIWHCVWSADSYLTGNADLDRQGFPTAADNAVGKGWDIIKNSFWSMQKSIYKKDSR